MILTKSIIETNVSGRIQTSKIDIISGCTFGTGNQIYQGTEYNSNHVEITYDWDPVIDDRGARYTTVGTTADFSFVRGNSNNSTKITIVNNVYEEYVEDEDGIRDSDIDSFDVLLEILPRGER